MRNFSKKDVFVLVLLSQILPLLGHAGNIMLYVIIVFLYISLKRNIILWKTRILWIPLAISFFIGFFLENYEAYTVFKDVFYLISPIMILALGEIFAERTDFLQLLKSVVVIGTVWSIVYSILNLAINGVNLIVNPREVRESYNLIFTVNSLILVSIATLTYCILYRKIKVVSYQKTTLFVNLLAIYFSGSRTLIVAIVIMFLFIAYPKLKKHKIIVFFSVISIVMIFSAIQFSDNRLVQSFLKSNSEVTSSEFDNYEDVSKNYRAYEAYVAISQISEAPQYQQFFGKGMGSYVDLGGLPDPLDVEKLPILHNGYPYILLKMGVFGMIVFMGFFIWLFLYFWRRKSMINQQSYSFGTAMCCGGILGLLIMNSSVTAIFNTAYSSMLIIIGFALRCSITNPSYEKNF